jgi:hypothetical protein
MRRDVAGDRQAVGFRGADERQCSRGGDVGEVQASAGHVADDLGEDRQVPCDRRGLGRRGPATQPEHGRNESLVRLRAIGLRVVLGMVDDRQPEGAGVREGVAQDRRRPNRRSVVGEPDDPGVGQLAERRQRLAGPSDCHGAVCQQLDGRAGGRRGRADQCQDARLIDGRRRVGHRADGGESAVGRRRQPGRDGLGILVARFAQMRVQVDEPGRDHDPRCVDAIGLVAGQPRDRLQDTVRDDELAGTGPSGRRIHQPDATQVEIGHAALTPASR